MKIYKISSLKNRVQQFAINNPIRQLFVRKYENIIPWGELTPAKAFPKEERDNVDRQLEDVADQMISELRGRIDPDNENSHYMKDVDLEREFEVQGDNPDIRRAQEQYAANPEAARQTVLDAINRDKKISFDNWFEYVYGQYMPTFAYMILKPIVDSSDGNTSAPPQPLNARALAETFDSIDGTKDLNLLKEYTKEVTSSSQMISGDLNEGWTKIPGMLTDPDNYRDNLTMLMTYGSAGSWCIGGSTWANNFLKEGDFYFYVMDSKPVVAIRTEGPTDVAEIQGFNNDLSNLLPYWQETLKFIDEQGLDPEYSANYRSLKEAVYLNKKVEDDPEYIRIILKQMQERNDVKEAVKMYNMLTAENRNHPGIDKYITICINDNMQYTPYPWVYYTMLPKGLKSKLSDKTAKFLIDMSISYVIKDIANYGSIPVEVRAKFDDAVWEQIINSLFNDPIKINESKDLLSDLKKYHPNEHQQFVQEYKKRVLDDSNLISNAQPPILSEISDYDYYSAMTDDDGEDRSEFVIEESKNDLFLSYIENGHIGDLDLLIGGDDNIYERLNEMYERLNEMSSDEWNESIFNSLKKNPKSIDGIYRYHEEELKDFFANYSSQDILGLLVGHEQLLSDFMEVFDDIGVYPEVSLGLIESYVTKSMKANGEQDVDALRRLLSGKNPSIIKHVSTIMSDLEKDTYLDDFHRQTIKDYDQAQPGYLPPDQPELFAPDELGSEQGRLTWFQRSMVKEAAPQYHYGRVRAVDYMKLMRDLDAGTKNLPLLNKMIADVKDQVNFVYWNTVAWGHTPQEQSYPCPDCTDDISDIHGVEPMIHIDEDNLDKWDEEFPGIRQQLEGYDLSDGVFLCLSCNKILTYDQLDEYIKDPTGQGRGVMVSDMADKIYEYWSKANEGVTFEQKFPYFEGLMEFAHRSGDLSEWFLEGGGNTIDKYRSSKLDV